MKELNRWERFEKSFPFYRMDVNGFMKLVNDARRITQPDMSIPLYETKYITLESLKAVMEKNEMWSAELHSEESGLIKFLNATCLHEGNADQYCIQNLRCIAILWCDGDVKEKVPELYDILQDNDQPSIAANDKDVAPALNTLFDFTGYTIL